MRMEGTSALPQHILSKHVLTQSIPIDWYASTHFLWEDSSMTPTSFVLKADLCYSLNPQTVATHRDSYLVCWEGRCAGVFPSLPAPYRDLPLYDYSGQLAVPGLVDLHAHAPQYAFRGLGMDLELLDWLNTHAFPEESRYQDLLYAEQAYRRFVDDMLHGPNTRACLFATLHTEATWLLMDRLEESGLYTMVGKVSMDRSSPAYLREPDADHAAREVCRWLARCDGRYTRTRPILTPRFIPSCSGELLARLHDIQRRTGLPVQSHLSENPGEVALVHRLFPKARHYSGAYHRFGLFGGDGCPTIMAHCVHVTPEEVDLLAAQQVFVAHCPASNANLSSGIAPVRQFLEAGVPVGLGSDVAGGTHLSLFRAMADAIRASKLRWRLTDAALAPLTTAEAFYLGTAGGGAFFGKVGTFTPGFAFDVIVLDDRRYAPVRAASLMDRLEQAIFLSEDRDITHKFVQGRQLF